MVQTCTFCIEMKAKAYKKPHEREECPLLRAAYCCHCACHGLHFTIDCPYKPMRSKPGTKPIEPAPPKPHSNALIMRDDEESIKSQLKVWGHETKSKKLTDKKLKALTKEYAEDYGYSAVSFI